MPSYSFTKFQSYGNDIVLFDARKEEIVLTEENIIYFCDRNFGIGCDEICVLKKSDKPDDEKGHNFDVQIYRGDGKEVGFAVNSFRACGIHLLPEVEKTILRFNTFEGQFLSKLDKENSVVKVNIGIPKVEGNFVDLKGRHEINIIENEEDIDFKYPDADVTSKNFMQIRSRSEIFVRTIEFNGEVFTSSLGVASCVAFGIKNNYLDEKVKVITRGSNIMDSSFEIVWDGNSQQPKPMLQGAPCSRVFTGEIDF